MNWTEGSLARHSRGRQRNALVARQKQHFAKARSSLLAGRTGHAPVEISFLGPGSALDEPSRMPLSRGRRDEASIPLLSLNREPRRGNSTRLDEGGLQVLPTSLDRRNRLLEKPDWAGLTLQKPLDISFPGQIYATKRWTGVARTPEKALDEPEGYTANHRVGYQNRLKRSPMRIQIGSQGMRPSVVTSSQPSTNRYIVKSERSPRIPRRNLMTDGSRRSRHPDLSGHGYTSTASEITPRALPASSDKPDTPVNVVYSSPVIREPAPRRIGNSKLRVLQWSPSSSESRASMEVQIGRPVRPVPPAQELEQQKWKAWILSDSSNLAEMDTSKVDMEDSESSALTLPSHLQPRLPSLHLSSDTESVLGHKPLEYVGVEGKTGNYSPLPDNRSPFDNHGLLPSNRQCITPRRVNSPDNLDDIWMKFALGDDENSEELFNDAFKAAAHQAAVDLQPSGTSNNADELIEDAVTSRTEPPSTNRNDAISLGPSSDSHMATRGTTCSETVASNIATVGSTYESSHNATRFVIPKAFVGKFANTERALIHRSSLADNGVPRGRKKGRRRRKKMATDGRTDIRDLPDFDGDPIEEIETD
ncbi:hypothetical protein F4802DRAFT_525363 [Xylaria palmicola]|nr:hypothetical protein F4802DRAFT_525363 [Xylaria palmicola]